jgi:hypothetical protein
MIRETATIANAGRPAARAAARMMATRARAMLSDAEQVLATVGDEEAAATAREAGEATTGLITATYDGKAQVFACKR